MQKGEKECFRINMEERFKFYSNRKILKRLVILILTILAALCFIRVQLIPHNSSHLRGRNSLLNFTNFNYIISSDICTENDIFLLILIHSAPSHFHQRNLIRNTWGKSDAKICCSIQVVFLLAVSTALQDDIEKENTQHKDIVQGNFIDSYHNLTYKHAMGLKWASENCAHASYLMKMDDDIFMDVFQFIEYMTEHFTVEKLKNKIACFVQSGMPVVRDPVSKWYVSKKEYSPDVFESYCSGWAYLTTPTVANVLFKALQNLDYFWVDDVHVTGTAAKKANISHIKINNLYDLESGGLVEWSVAKEDMNWDKIFAPTWGDFVLSRTAYRKTLKCWVVKCKCCYSRKTTIRPTQASTTRKGIAKLLSL